MKRQLALDSDHLFCAMVFEVLFFARDMLLHSLMLLFQIPKDLNTLHSHVNEWSLADDAGLLHLMEEFSTKLKTEMRLVEKDLDELLFDTKMCHTGLKNTFTSFAMLSNKQVCLELL